MLRRRPIIWVSGCLGSDSHSLVSERLKGALNGEKFIDIYFAEVDAKRQEWIANLTDLLHLFWDVFDIIRSHDLRYRRSRVVRVNAGRDRKQDFMFIGLRCINASRLNRMLSSAGCINNIECQTGSTLLGAVLAVTQQRPRFS